MEFITANYQNIAEIEDMIHITEKIIDISYPDVFKGLGKIGTDVKFTVDLNIHPTQTPLRKVPIALRDELIDEIKKLQQL